MCVSGKFQAFFLNTVTVALLLNSQIGWHSQERAEMLRISQVMPRIPLTHTPTWTSCVSFCLFKWLMFFFKNRDIWQIFVKPLPLNSAWTLRRIHTRCINDKCVTSVQYTRTSTTSHLYTSLWSWGKNGDMYVNNKNRYFYFLESLPQGFVQLRSKY